YILNPANGAVVQTLGSIGFSVTGLAVHPLTGVLYGSTGNASSNAPGSLIRIDKATGAGTLIGSFRFPGQTMADLTFTSDGTLYGWLPFKTSVNSEDLYTINLTTGAATKVGESSLPGGNGDGLAANNSTATPRPLFGTRTPLVPAGHG